MNDCSFVVSAANADIENQFVIHGQPGPWFCRVVIYDLEASSVRRNAHLIYKSTISEVKSKFLYEFRPTYCKLQSFCNLSQLDQHFWNRPFSGNADYQLWNCPDAATTFSMRCQFPVSIAPQINLIGFHLPLQPLALLRVLFVLCGFPGVRFFDSYAWKFVLRNTSLGVAAVLHALAFVGGEGRRVR